MLGKIEHFVVLMLENRSFDHLVGYLKENDSRIDGISGGQFSNREDPNNPSSLVVPVVRAKQYAMQFDPGHEFEDSR